MLRRFGFAVVLLAGSLGLAQAKRPFTFEDMMALKRVGEPVPSPNGNWVAFSAATVNLEANTHESHIYVVPIAGGHETQLIADGPGESRPRWSPDGRQLAFVSARDGMSQIWAADFDPATATLGVLRKLTTIITGASGELWSPDGKSILFTSEVWTDCKDDACNRRKDAEIASSKVKAKVFTHLLYRHWNAYETGKRTHIFVQPVDGSAPPLDLTPGDHDAPPFSLGGQDMYSFSPDGKEVAFTSNIDEVEATSTNNEIFIVSVTGGAPKRISTSPGSDSAPLYSPDGKYIAWRMQEKAGYESDRFKLVVYDREYSGVSGCGTDERQLEKKCRSVPQRIRVLTERFDRWVESFAWNQDSKWLFFSAEDNGEAPIYAVCIDGEAPRVLLRGHSADLAVSKGKLLFSKMSASAANEIYAGFIINSAASDCSGLHCNEPASLVKTIPQGEKGAVPLTHLNDVVLSQIQMSPIESFRFKGAQKANVQGFIVKPPDFNAAKKYPVKFLIHGGPQGAWGDSWSYRWNSQLFAANGYVVVMINPRGSTGYGQKFIDEINRDWGGRAYQDLMMGLDYVATTYPFADTTRACAMGASYGGYMANWIEGNTTRFKCIVSHDGMFNPASAWGTTEELWFNEWEFKGTPWTNRPLYQKWSPALKAPNFKTPMLVIHGQLDYRLDVSEGFQLFSTLQRLKVPSKMLYFPDEGHWVLKPQNSQLWYKTVNEWVDKWTEGGSK
jgi:dipeptidyl aminopeptidase/acylaminoacyl peptidase